MGVPCLSLFGYALLCVHFSFTIILKRNRKLVALLVLSYWNCSLALLMVPWVVLQYAFMVFPDHTHLLLNA